MYKVEFVATPLGLDAPVLHSEDPREPAGSPSATILIVDDEPLVRSATRRLLQRAGYEAIEASSAQEAREALGRHPRVRLVLLDQSMPKESGMVALASLRALSGAREVLFTGLPPEGPLEVDAVLTKPARPEELLRVVRAVLRGARA